MPMFSCTKSKNVSVMEPPAFGAFAAADAKGGADIVASKVRRCA